jgi:predicted Ser/Thr protein kinase
VIEPCPSCSHPVPASARYCAGCGAQVDLASTPTGTAPRGPVAVRSAGAGVSRPPSAPRESPSSGARISSGVASDARFPPGTLVGGRYRVVGLIGRGGMGEVYRADDLTLGQPVALKFLPEALQEDPERRDRFFNEVRMARQVTHAAVCRVHDVGEVDGHLFLSMEYVDGEDLGSLLRRVGRLSSDKSVEIARQLCAGIAAAHDKGVLHRDLKPENVMLDGRGRVRITDFGLAGLSDAIRGGDVRSGTPAYMAPEQLEGREVTVRSDIYSLGLVLYELFTAKRAFTGRTMAELVRQHRDSEMASPSTVVDGLDPAVESAILRCLEKDPADRPPSALAVAAALPGGDPLAAALAAGETPSPEMVAALAAAEGMAPAKALACAAMVVAAMVAVPLLGRGLQLPSTVPLPRSPAALEDRAAEFVRQLGYTEPPADEARGWGLDMDHMQWAIKSDPSPARWKGFPTNDPPFLIFWYRSSPRPLTSPLTSGRVSHFQPPLNVSGMTQVQLDTLGRLIALFAVPPQVVDPTAGAAPRGDPRLLFGMASLDFARFHPVTPKWLPDVYADERGAWEGPYTAREYPIRVEAAWYRGRPVYFEIVSPWSRPQRAQPFQFSPRQNMGARIGLVIVMVVMAVAGLLARRHLKMGRGDRRGATRVAAFALVVGLVAWALEADHVAELGGEMGLILRGASGRLMIAAFMWVLYVALEPFVRRRWPRTLVSWTRLLAGRFRDPLVARDILVGAAGGALGALIFYATDNLPRGLGLVPATPWFWVELDPLLGMGYTAAEILGKVLASVAVGLGLVLLLLFFWSILRREWLAAAALVLVTAAQPLLFSDAPWWIVAPAAIALRAIPVFLALRFGVLATIASFVVSILLAEMPLAADLTTWAGVPAIAVFVTIGALVLYGVQTATGGRAFGLGLPD